MNEEKIQVLLADDEDPLRMTIAAWLNDEGFSVDEAGDGLEAIKKTGQKPPRAEAPLVVVLLLSLIVVLIV